MRLFDFNSSSARYLLYAEARGIFGNDNVEYELVNLHDEPTVKPANRVMVNTLNRHCREWKVIKVINMEMWK